MTADAKPSVEAYHSATIEPIVVVSEGTGKTANLEGAKAKEVFNVSNPTLPAPTVGPV